ncbi:MAG: small metal-binding protein SmbP [Gammaproteobacteria bacterium]
MKKMTLIITGLFVFLSFAVFAEEHADAALEHTKMAIVHGKAGHAPVLQEHANTALIHAQKAVEKASGEAKTHMQAAVKSLESAVEHAKMGPGHEEMATKAAEEAAEHIKAGNK